MDCYSPSHTEIKGFNPSVYILVVPKCWSIWRQLSFLLQWHIDHRNFFRDIFMENVSIKVLERQPSFIHWDSTAKMMNYSKK